MAKTKFRPLHDRVVVRRIQAEEKTKGGIIIPDTAQEKPSQGEITAVGPGGRDEAGKLIPIDLKVGVTGGGGGSGDEGVVAQPAKPSASMPKTRAVGRPWRWGRLIGAPKARFRGDIAGQ